MEIQEQAETSGTTNMQALGRWKEKMTLTMQQMTENFEKGTQPIELLFILLNFTHCDSRLVFSAAPLLFYCCVLPSPSVLS